MEKFKSLYKKYREIILYLIFGGLTTLVNFIIYFSAVFLGADIYVSNIAAWIGAVLFAYITNRKMVFQSDSKSKKSILKEILLFYGARVFSLIVETVLLFLFVELLFMNEYISKIILQILVIVLNYVFSKFLIFRKK